jgi:hypothetical protein
MHNVPVLKFSAAESRHETPAERVPADPSWIRRHRWGIGMVAMTTLGGFWWRRRVRQRRIKLEPMSDEWLREREYESGQQGEDAWER